MGEPSLRELEHDVEIARSKLARDLSNLRSPDTYSQFASAVKQEASSAKDALFEKAKSSVQGTVESFVEDLKAKAAANPTAALAISAGIAWRLIQRPPIATALVGVGLFSLLRTQARPVNGRSNSEYVAQATHRLREQASDFAADVKEYAGNAAETAKEKMTELAGVATERAGQAIEAAAGRVTDAATAAKGRVQALGDQAASTVGEVASQVKEQAASMPGKASKQIAGLQKSVARVTDKVGITPRVEALSNSVENAIADQGTRDSVLLGAAAIAVVAALGIACQKKLAEATPAN
jgi:hypothetical protein